MPDILTLNGPQGTSLNVGSYLEGDPDFGDSELFKALRTENPAAEGGLLAYEFVGARQMVFPMRVPSSVGLSPGQLQGMVRQLARPGATLDVQLDGEPSANAIRFDILAGRLESHYELPLWRGLRQLRANLKLDVQPYGYLPTMILLASAASVGLPGQLALSGAGIVGDAPGLAELVVRATVATDYPAGTWVPDMLAWSLAARPSFQNYWGAGSLTGLVGGPTLNGDAFAVASQALQFTPSTGWVQGVKLTIASALEPAYRGRHRVFAHAQLSPSQGLPFYLSVDAAPDVNPSGALASWQPIATLPPIVASGAPGAFGAQASPAYVFVDLGELTLPPVGSGVQQALQLRLWSVGATTNPGVATANLRIAGLSLLPLDGPAGILPRGLAQPTINTAGTVGQFELDGPDGLALIAAATGGFASSPPPYADARVHHRGAVPLIGASTTQLDLLAGMRTTASGATGPLAFTAPAFAGVSARYRPRFAFIRSF